MWNGNQHILGWVELNRLNVLIYKLRLHGNLILLLIGNCFIGIATLFIIFLDLLIFSLLFLWYCVISLIDVSTGRNIRPIISIYITVAIVVAINAYYSNVQLNI